MLFVWLLYCRICCVVLCSVPYVSSLAITHLLSNVHPALDTMQGYQGSTCSGSSSISYFTIGKCNAGSNGGSTAQVCTDDAHYITNFYRVRGEAVSPSRPPAHFPSPSRLTTQFFSCRTLHAPTVQASPLQLGAAIATRAAGAVVTQLLHARRAPCPRQQWAFGPQFTLHPIVPVPPLHCP